MKSVSFSQIDSILNKESIQLLKKISEPRTKKRRPHSISRKQSFPSNLYGAAEKLNKYHFPLCLPSSPAELYP